MRLLSLAARPLLGSLFLTCGIAALRDPWPQAESAGPLLGRAREAVPALPEDGTVLIRGIAAAQVAAGGMLALGKAPRLSALVLAATLLSTAYADHAWWEEDDPVMRAQHRLEFTKDAAVLGGLLAVLGDSGGRPSLAWRTRHAVRGRRSALRCAKAHTPSLPG